MTWPDGAGAMPASVAPEDRLNAGLNAEDGQLGVGQTERAGLVIGQSGDRPAELGVGGPWCRVASDRVVRVQAERDEIAIESLVGGVVGTVHV